MSTLFIIVGLSVLVFIHEAGHFFAARFFKLRVDEFGFGLPPRLWGKRIGDTIYSVNWLPFGGFVKLYGEEGGENLTMWHGEKKGGEAKGFATEPAWIRSTIILAGVFMNFVLGWLLLSLALMIGTPKGVIVSDVAPGSPAAEAGLMEGDKIANYDHSEDFIGFVQSQKGTATEFKILRDGGELTVTMTPRIDPPAGEGSLGVGLAEGGGRAGFFEAFKTGFELTIYSIKAIFVGLFMLIKGFLVGEGNLEGVVGPVGILGVASKAGGLGYVYLLQLVALISINLGAINVVPFPALDGGRFLFIILEKIKGSPISLKTERVANSIGFGFLVLLMLAITARDVVKLL